VVDDPACLVGRAQQKAVQPQGPVPEVYREYSVDSFVKCIAVWGWDGGLGGELAVIGHLM
jgi:hypothetical protein